MSGFRPCAIVPTYRHVDALRGVVERLVAEGLPVLVVDDGNAPEIAAQIADICVGVEGVELLRRETNGGKGAAVLDGIAWAEALGFSHAVQVDADGQHDIARVGDLLALARAEPDALVTGEPVYDETIPRSRRIARWITHFWVAVNTLTFRYIDSMCGFRVYPVGPVREVARAHRIARRMAFDTEVLVRLVWRGTKVVTLPVAVIYPPGNHSNFALWDDNLRISGMHAKLFFIMLARLPFLVVSRLRGPHENSSRHWARISERGGYAGLWLLGTIYRLFGRRVCLAAVSPVVLFFFLTGSEQRRGSLSYLAHAHDAGLIVERPGWRLSFRHFMAFASSAVDKLAAWTGNIPASQVEGLEDGEFERAKQSGQGALVFTAHFGNPEILRAIATLSERWRVTVLVHTVNAVRFNRFINAFSESSAVRLVQVTSVGPDTAILLQQAVERGEWVVVAGDRVPVSGNERISWAPFLGELAPFPQGPHIIAALLKCPVYLLFCLRNGPRHRVHFERMADRIELPRRDREGALAASVAEYARRLEKHLRAAPLQWFNFFDFWHPAGLKPPSVSVLPQRDRTGVS
ncbi:MAG: glycosyltransferase family 2 protein [Parvibaculum sp.]|uniref:glycosyltransferase family 2 protein n=1 Tax=Parvibaculum sp. TaxID=2024848 RepID=UPI001B2CCC33|nr:glycosyltransferase family 2 protein [Parvibaculum sp.]MBO6685052.1 glycosyltransferase family 2 protein [Parvibaculum sp.]